jgi:multiple sugar transport system substrate-binding protein
MNRKRFVTLTVLVLLTLLAIAPLHAQDEDVTLTILHSMGPDTPKGPLFEQLIADFEAEYPNIDVDAELVPDSEIGIEAELAYSGGVEADIILHNYPNETALWVEDGLTIPLNELIEEWELLDSFLPGAISEYTNADEELAALPFEGFDWPIWYNTAVFEDAGLELPTTLEDIAASADALREAGYQPFVTGGADWTGSRFFQFLITSYLTEDETYDLFANGGFADNENAVAAVETFVEWRDSGVFADDVEGLEFSSMNETFFAGEAAMMHGGSWSFPELPEDMLDVVVIDGLPPAEMSPYDTPTMWAAFAAKGVHVSRNGAENLDAVGTFIQYLYRPEVMARFVNETAVVPPITGVPLDEENLNPLFVQSLNALEEVAIVPLIETIVPPSIADLWLQAAQDAYVPGMSAEDIITSIDSLYDMVQ